MIPYPEIDPVLVQIGPLALRWYGLMYLLGFAGGYFYLRYLIRKRELGFSRDTLADLIFYVIFGVIFGGRLGYVIFYNLPQYLEQPLDILKVWQGGMSFHGGLLGVIVASLIFCHRRGLPVLVIGDLLASAAPIGLGLGRLGNFINAELWGRKTDVPWAMIFPGGGPYPRHPSQLYEAILEGLILFLCLWALHKRQVRFGVPFFSFFLLYGVFRFGVEFFREPDLQLGMLLGWATMGQLLCIPMIIFGAGGLWWLFREKGSK